MFRVPISAGEPETLLKHPDKIPSLPYEMVVDLIQNPSSVFYFLLLGIPVITLPAFTLYGTHCSLSVRNRLKGKTAWSISLGIYFLALGTLSYWSSTHNPIWPPIHDAGDTFPDTDERSTDLEADIRAMWQVGDPEPDRTWVTATSEAIRAANRVFNTVELHGMTLDDAKQILRLDLRAPNYGYIAPFWPVGDNTYPLRFDNGCWGWQFDIIVDEHDCITEVRRTWIH